MPIGTLLIFSLFANNVRTAGLIGPQQDDGAY